MRLYTNSYKTFHKGWFSVSIPVFFNIPKVTFIKWKTIGSITQISLTSIYSFFLRALLALFWSITRFFFCAWLALFMCVTSPFYARDQPFLCAWLALFMRALLLYPFFWVLLGLFYARHYAFFMRVPQFMHVTSPFYARHYSFLCVCIHFHTKSNFGYEEFFGMSSYMCKNFQDDIPNIF